MRGKRATGAFLTVGALSLMLLASVACAPSLPTAEMQDLPAGTPTRPADVRTRTSPPSTPSPTTPGQGATPTPGPSPGSTVTLDAEAEEAVSTAKADLVKRLGVTEEEIVVRSVEAVEWPDASLGCPQPGIIYAQVVTPGFRVILEANGQTYDYHTDTGRLVILCAEDASSFDPVPLMPVAPHGIKPRKP
jgi:hypothetical protein